MDNRFVFASMFGVSDMDADRAQRLLAFEIGQDQRGDAVSVRSMLAQQGHDPEDVARLLMLVPPLDAVARLTRLMAGFVIDGEIAADPAAAARAALAHAGRVVTAAQMYPELGWLRRALAMLRRWRQ